MSKELPYGGYWYHGRGGWTWIQTDQPGTARLYAERGGHSIEDVSNPMRHPANPNESSGSGFRSLHEEKPKQFVEVGHDNDRYKGEFWPDGTPNKFYGDVYKPEDRPAGGVGLKKEPPPHITGNPRTTGGEGSAAPADRTAFRVGTGSLREVEIAMATPVGKTIEAYAQAKLKVDTQKGWMFAFDNAGVPGMRKKQGMGRGGGRPRRTRTETKTRWPRHR